MTGWWLVAFGFMAVAWREARRYDAGIGEPRSHVDPPRTRPDFYDWEVEQ